MAPVSAPSRADRRAFRTHLRARQPGFWTALEADTRLAAAAAGRKLSEPAGPLELLREARRLAREGSPLPGLLLHRSRARLQALGVPLIPRLLQRLAIGARRIYIGDPVLVEAGIRISAGPVVIDGITEVGAGTVIGPGCTIGLATGDLFGPTIGRRVEIGAGAKVIGQVRVGDGARIAPGSVVVDDVEPDAQVSGLPARVAAPPG